MKMKELIACYDKSRIKIVTPPLLLENTGPPNAHLNDNNLISVRIGELFEFWSDHLAWAAPGGMEIYQNQEFSSGLQLGVEVGL